MLYGSRRLCRAAAVLCVISHVERGAGEGGGAVPAGNPGKGGELPGRQRGVLPS